MKTDRPYRTRIERGILHVTLDTPRARVNIFDLPAAEQLAAILQELPPGLRAIVFESGKPGSFINGAALMMASAVKSKEAAAEVSAPILRAYDLVERAPVPTIAAIEGSCFGCGVEFTLRCRHRIATDRPETQLYMTELCDYLLSPAFGSVSRLPPLLGLDRAADFLLWGERWSAQDALRAGLLDRVARTGRLDGTIEGLLAHPPQSAARRTTGGSARRHLARIDRLPPALQPLYRSCLRLMMDATPERELALSAKTAAAPIAKRALGFFFVRQIASELCHFGETRPLPEPPRTIGALARALGVSVRRSITGRPPKQQLYRPDRRRRRALVEVQRSGVSATLVHHLERIGQVPIVSSPVRRFAIDALLIAHLRPLLEASARGANVEETLRRFGFVEGPGVLLARFDVERLFPAGDARWIRRLRSGRPSQGRVDPRLIDALCLSWLASVRDLLTTGVIAHPTIVDLAARELLDFPLEHRSLCSFLTRARVSTALSRIKRGDEAERAAAEAYVSGIRDFYS